MCSPRQHYPGFPQILEPSGTSGALQSRGSVEAKVSMVYTICNWQFSTFSVTNQRKAPKLVVFYTDNC